MDYDFLLDDDRSPFIDRVNHSSDSQLKFAPQICLDECHDLAK